MNSQTNDIYQEIDQELENSKTNPQKIDEVSKGTKLDDIEYRMVSSTERIKNPFKRFWKWLTIDKGRLGSIIFLFLFVVLIIVLAALDLDIGSLMTNIVDWFEANLSLWGIYIGVFVISVFGNFTVIFPVPYTFVLVSVASRDYITVWNVLLMGLFAGAGAAIGEAVSWTLGRASKKVIEDSMEKQVNRAQRWIDAGLAPIMILIFAATPLPDDAILVIIGLLGYALWKTLIWCFLGKIILTSTTGLIAKFLYDTPFGQFFFRIFGLTEEKPAIWVSALAWIGTLVLIGVIMFLDWGDIWNKLTRKTVIKKYKELSLKYHTRKDNELSVAITSNHKDGFISTKINLPREDYLWQCVTKNARDQYPDYHDMYALPYVLGQSKNIIIDSQWLTVMEKHFENNNYTKASQLDLEKIILPKNLKENITEDELKEFTENLVYISFNFLHSELKKKFHACLLLEKISQNELKVRCIGEKEALVIKNIKSVEPEIILNGYINLLNNVALDPSNVRKIDYAKYSKDKEMNLDE